MDSDQDSSEDELVQVSTPQEREESKETSAPPSVLQHRLRAPRQDVVDGQRAKSSTADSGSKVAVVMVTGPVRPWEYQAFDHSTTVDEVLEEVEGPDEELWYKVQYEDGNTENVSFNKLLKLRNGSNALDFYNNENNDDIADSEDHSSMFSPRGKRVRTQTKNAGFVNSNAAQIDSETSEDEQLRTSKKRRLEKGRIQKLTASDTRQSSRISSRQSSRRVHNEDQSDSDEEPAARRSTKAFRAPSSRKRLARSTSAKPAIFEDGEDELAGDLPGTEEDDDDESDILYAAPKKRSTRNKPRPGNKMGTTRKRGIFGRDNSDESSDPERAAPTRISGRTTKASKSMREQAVDEEVYADDVAATTAPKIISVREVFQPLPERDPFRVMHNTECDVCNGKGKHSNKGTSSLIHCQGCSTSIHKMCLGYRSGREHMVTKVGHDSFVMQCRRCIGLAIKKDDSAPRLDICQGCNEPGAACAAFSKKKTSKQEEKLREENDGQDPITEVSPNLINNAENVLFRCKLCQRAYHYEHLPPRGRKSKTPDDKDELRELRHSQYKADYRCKECCEQPAKVQTLVAWRPSDRDSYSEDETIDMFREDEKEYLIKWEELSYFHCTWMPGAWVWGVTSAIMRNAFARRDEGANHLPKWTTEEAIPEDFLRMEIVFDVKYSEDFEAESEETDKENIGLVEEVLVKFVGLGYEEAVWEARPSPKQPRLWSAFVAAYNEYIAGKYFKKITASELKERLEDFRELDFGKYMKIPDKEQPSALVGGELMPYQRAGCNWLLKNFHDEKSVILADEMGLGKTIQIISMIAALVKDTPQCWPFLIITPNSTCPNWRREIKKWAPSLRVVAYYGGKKARDMAMRYEMYPDGCKDLRAHIVVTSYEGPTGDDSKAFFRKIKWAGMVIDEGQRLKNDQNLLYIALKALKVSFRVLLTGTPLQNNTRELFNLLQFIDPSMNAAELDEKYAELTNEKIKELQALIEPYFMRRTKRDVLKFLPSMAQVIVPTTMTVLQKKLYKSILAKNPELIKSIFGQSKTALRPQEKGNLNNILVQLRKVLCHPFMFSDAIEERSESSETMHRNLIDASSKLQLLEIMLPKLKERGHRVLIFSQFLEHLNIIEDFLSGLGLAFGRLDGTVSTMDKQKRIDAYNAPNSPMFAFLLSTRAGGVGINLATADTVIIMDPDFNPHQDIQALSRAHRIGQEKKVLVFQLMTKDSAEEKITQIGRKKMALDHALIETMGADDDVPMDLESILKHGAEALFNDDDSNDIHYDSTSVDKLLDRTQMETTSTDEDKVQESAFSHARIWTNDKLSDNVGDPDAESSVPDASVWAKILKQREEDAAAEAAKNVETLGRGKRVRATVDYHKSEQLDENIASSPAKGHRRRRTDSESDIEFAAVVESDDDDFDAPPPSDVDLAELRTGTARRSSGGSPTTKKQGTKKHSVTPVKKPQSRPASSGQQKVSAKVPSSSKPKVVQKANLEVAKSSEDKTVKKPINKKPSIQKEQQQVMQPRTVSSTSKRSAKDIVQQPQQKKLKHEMADKSSTQSNNSEAFKSRALAGHSLSRDPSTSTAQSSNIPNSIPEAARPSSMKPAPEPLVTKDQHLNNTSMASPELPVQGKSSQERLEPVLERTSSLQKHQSDTNRMERSPAKSQPHETPHSSQLSMEITSLALSNQSNPSPDNGADVQQAQISQSPSRDSKKDECLPENLSLKADTAMPAEPLTRSGNAS